MAPTLTQSLRSTGGPPPPFPHPTPSPVALGPGLGADLPHGFARRPRWAASGPSAGARCPLRWRVQGVRPLQPPRIPGLPPAGPLGGPHCTSGSGSLGHLPLPPPSRPISPRRPFPASAPPPRLCLPRPSHAPPSAHVLPPPPGGLLLAWVGARARGGPSRSEGLGPGACPWPTSSLVGQRGRGARPPSHPGPATPPRRAAALSLPLTRCQGHPRQEVTPGQFA